MLIVWLVLACAAAAAAAAAAARRRLTVVVIDGESMSPAFRSGDRVLVARRAAGFSVGEVVVFRYANGPEGKLIKRVAAVAGDLVPPDVLAAARAQPGTRVPDGFLVVIGDAAQSTDSRSWGYLPAGKVIGVVVRQLGGGPAARSPVPGAAPARAAHTRAGGENRERRGRRAAGILPASRHRALQVETGPGAVTDRVREP